MILITGASGRIGRRTAELLAAHGEELRLMSRDPEKVPRLPGAEAVRGDFEIPETLHAAFAGVEAALVISGSAPPGERAKLHRNAFEAAKRAGVGHVVYLSLQGSGPESRYPYSRDHYESEQYLAASGTPYTVLRNAFYLDMFLDQFGPDGVVRGPADAGRGAFVSREDVARTSAAVLMARPGGILDVTGPEALTVAEVAQRLSKLTGRELRYEEETAEATRERVLGSDGPEGKAELAAGWFEAIAAGELEKVSDTVRRFTGKAPRSLENYFGGFPDLLKKLRGGAS